MDLKEIAGRSIDTRGWVEIVIVGTLGVVIWMKSLPQETDMGQYAQAAPAEEVSAVEHETIKPQKVIVYVDRAKKDLDLPAAIQSDPNEHVLDASTLKSDEHPQTAVCTQNAITGKSEMIVRADPLPWLAAENRGEVRLAMGASNGARAVQLSGHEDVLEIGAIHLGINGSFDDLSHSFVGIGAAYKW